MFKFGGINAIRVILKYWLRIARISDVFAITNPQARRSQYGAVLANAEINKLPNGEINKLANAEINKLTLEY